jgi:PAS domain S-box-containing protein
MNNNQAQRYQANILVVDDTPNNLRLLSAMLTQLGYEVRRVINGQTALKTAQAAPPDLILLDIMMPDMNGYEVCQHLKACEQTRDIPVIFISALDEVLDKVKAFAVGGVDYITKPFSEEEVFARVENNLTIRRLQKQLTEQNARLQQESRDRQRAESALQLSQFYLDRSRDSVFFINADARFVYVNEAACRTLGYSCEQLLTLSVHDIDPNFPAATWQSHWQELRQRGSFTFESTHRTKDGRDISVEITVNYLEFNGQEYHCAIVRDITARKQAEAALTRSEAKFRNLFENSLVGIFRTRTEDGLLLEANQRFIQMLGYSCAADVINQKSATDFYFDLSGRQRILAELKAKGVVHNFETQVRKRDGSAIWVLFSARMNVEEDCLEGVVTEISDRPSSTSC